MVFGHIFFIPNPREMCAMGFWLVFLTFRSILGAKLAPIDPAMEAAIVRHALRNISALGEDGIGAARPELQ